LQEGNTKSPDLKFDGKTWDVKYIEKASEHRRKQLAAISQAVPAKPR
jgi:hypothetical protein